MVLLQSDPTYIQGNGPTAPNQNKAYATWLKMQDKATWHNWQKQKKLFSWLLRHGAASSSQQKKYVRCQLNHPYG